MHSLPGFYTQKKKYVIAASNIIMNEKWFIWRGSAYGFPRGEAVRESALRNRFPD